MSAGDGVHELHGEAQLSSRLPQIAFHHVTGAQFLAGGAHVNRVIGVARSRTARDHPQIGEARQAGHYVFGQSRDQSREICVGAGVLEWQHRDPEPFLGARGARVVRVRIGAASRAPLRTGDEDCSTRSKAMSLADWNRLPVLLEAVPDDVVERGRDVPPRLRQLRRLLSQDRRHRVVAVSRLNALLPESIS